MTEKRDFIAKIKQWDETCKTESILLLFEAKDYHEAVDMVQLYQQKFMPWNFEIVYIKESKFYHLDEEWNKLLNESKTTSGTN